jgi:polyhydroxyalkanoate synthesis regulator phasin
MQKEAWRAYLDLALGLTESSRKQATKTAMKLVGKGGATAAQLQALVEETLAAGTANRAVVERLVRNEVDRALGVVGLAKSDEVDALRKRVTELEEQLAPASAAPTEVPGETTVEAAATTPPAPLKKVVAKKVMAKKAVAKAPAGGTAVPDALVTPAASEDSSTPVYTSVTPVTPAPLATSATPAEDEPAAELPAETPARRITPPQKTVARKKAVPTPADLPPAVKKVPPAKRAKKAVPPLFDDGTQR